MQEGTFPNCLKIAKVIPVFKKGQMQDASNYRPISLIPVIGKVFEYVIFNQVNEYFRCFDLFNRVQYGFSKGKSTVDAIRNLVDKILFIFESGGYVLSSFCDLSMAFDSIEHNILIDKLRFYGIQGKQLKFFESYLTDRKQIVYVNGEFSSVRNLSNGVPQGSILGPLLFLIAVNDLPNNIDIDTIMFADDTTLVTFDKDLKSNSTMENAGNKLKHCPNLQLKGTSLLQI